MKPLILPTVSPYVWVIGGVHGNEHAPVAAICNHGIFPNYCLVIPCLNPIAFISTSRIESKDEDYETFHAMLDLSKIYTPKLIINLHEDDEAFQYVGFYIYHYGKNIKLAQIALDAIKAKRLPIAPNEDDTWESEQIKDGKIVDIDDTPSDPSIEKYCMDTYGTEGIVAETPSNMWPRKARLRAHEALLSSIPLMYKELI